MEASFGNQQPVLRLLWSDHQSFNRMTKVLQAETLTTGRARRSVASRLHLGPAGRVGHFVSCALVRVYTPAGPPQAQLAGKPAAVANGTG
jgi:hypothetical protein